MSSKKSILNDVATNGDDDIREERIATPVINGFINLEKTFKRQIIELLASSNGRALLAEALKIVKEAEKDAVSRSVMVTQEIVLPDKEIFEEESIRRQIL